MLQDLADDTYHSPAAAWWSNLRLLADADLVFEFLVHPRHLPAGEEPFSKRFRGLRAVIDHLAKPPIAHWGPGPLAPEDLAAVAEVETVYL